MKEKISALINALIKKLNNLIPKNNSLRIILSIIGITIVAVLLMLLFKPGNHMVVQAEKTWKVTTISLTSTSARPEVILHGKTESTSLTAIEAAISADVIETPILEGEYANKGDLLLKLDDREAKLILQQAEASITELEATIASELVRYQTDKETIDYEKRLLELSKTALEREQYLEQRNIGTGEAVDVAQALIQQRTIDLNLRDLAISDHENRLAQLQAQLSRAQAEYNQAALDLSRATIYALFNTRVITLNVAPGNRVQAGEILLEMYSPQEIEIRAAIPTRYLTAIKLALQKGEVINGTAAIDGVLLDVRLDRLASAVEQTRGSVDGIFIINNEPPYLALSRPITIRLRLPEQDNIYLIPTTALYGTDRIYAVNADSRLVRIEATPIGSVYNVDSDASMILIRGEELIDGMNIITTQIPQVRDNLLVEVVNE